MRVSAAVALLVLMLAALSSPAFAGRASARGPGTGVNHTNSTNPVPAIPEPGAFGLFAIGAGMVAIATRRRRTG